MLDNLLSDLALSRKADRVTKLCVYTEDIFLDLSLEELPGQMVVTVQVS